MCVVNSEDLRIPVRVRIIACFGRPGHYIATAASVYRIPVTADIICCVVDRELLCRKDGIVDNSDGVSFVVRKKAGVVTIEALPKKPAEKVNAEFGGKILESRSERQHHSGRTKVYLRSWVGHV